VAGLPECNARSAHLHLSCKRLAGSKSL
jgi:hypothetical protein